MLTVPVTAGNAAWVFTVPLLRSRSPEALRLFPDKIVTTKEGLLNVIELTNAVTSISMVFAPVKLTLFNDVGTPFGFQLFPSPQLFVAAPASHVFRTAKESSPIWKSPSAVTPNACELVGVSVPTVGGVHVPPL